MKYLLPLLTVLMLVGCGLLWAHSGGKPIYDHNGKLYGTHYSAHTHEPITHDQKYRVVWHEFVALTIGCGDSLPLPYGGDTISRAIRYVQLCDTVGFRPTVIEYILIEDSL